MQEKQLFHFGPYTFEPDNAQLRRGKRVLPVTRKACEVLQCLVAQPGHLVTKDALFAAVWPETVVSEGVLTNCIGELRRVLGDTTSKRRYIETVSGRGYRFLSTVTAHPWQGSEAGGEELVSASPTEAERVPVHPVLSPPVAPRAQTPVLVGREGELLHLHQLLTKARQGERQIVFVTGEAGIGKTALLDSFLQSLVAGVEWQGGERASVCVAHGQCVEHYGAGEAYLPILEALSRLGRQADGGDVRRVLRRVAPTWLVQLPALLDEADYAALQPKVVGATRERMLREMVEALEALSAERVLVLVLEDAHWSDASTMDLVHMLARRRDPARVLVVVTCRPAEVLISAHPLKRVKHDVVSRGQGVEMVLGRLSVEDVQQYVRQRWATATERAATVVHRRTAGHPLFMVQMTEYLRQHTAAETLDAAALDAVERLLPQQLRDLLEAQLGRLTGEERAILEAASVVGAEFTVASVAAVGLGSAERVETTCEQLAQRGQFLVEREVATWPDGTVSGRYGFRHALYHEVLYHRLSAGRRVRLHRQIGTSMEAAYGKRAQEIAAELAMHFEQGRDNQRAVQHLTQAAANATQRYAPHEVIALLSKGLELLATLPETQERAQQELDMQLALGPAWKAIKGSAAPEVEQTYARARALCAQVGETPQLLLVLLGLSYFYFNRGALRTARELAEQLFGLVQRAIASTHLLEAHAALGLTLFFLGDYAAAQARCEQGMACSGPTLHHVQAPYHGAEPGVECLVMTAHSLWCLGYPAQAVRWSQEGLARAQTLAHPYSLAFAHHYATYLHYRRRDVPAVQAQAEALHALALAQGFPLWVSMGTFWRGWGLAMQGQSEVGLAQMQQSLADVVAIGVMLAQPFCQVPLAETLGHTGQVTAGLRLLAEALVQIETGEHGYLRAEAYRLQGVLWLQQAVPDAQQAEASFQQALAVARCQQAKSLELRAAMSLSRLWHHQGKRAEAGALLAEVYGWFTEGFDTADLQEARALLEILAGWGTPEGGSS